MTSRYYTWNWQLSCGYRQMRGHIASQSKAESYPKPTRNDSTWQQQPWQPRSRWLKKIHDLVLSSGPLSYIPPSRNAVDDRFQHTPWCVHWHHDMNSQAFKWFTGSWKLVFALLMKCPAFKWCSWRPIPSYAQCAYWRYYWHRDQIVELAISRAFKWHAKPF